MAWSLVAAYFTLSTVGLALQALANASYTNQGVPVLTILIILVGMWPIIGALIVSRHPHHPVGWLLCASFITPSFDMFAAGYASYDHYVYPGSLPGVALALIWLTWSSFPFATAAFTLIILLFPDGHLPSSSWRKVAWTAIAALLVYLPLRTLQPGSVDSSFDASLINSVGVSASLWDILEPLMWLSFTVLALCYAAAVFSLIARLHHARGDVRQQIKWLVFPSVLYLISLPLLILGLFEPSEVAMGIGLILGQPAIAGMVIAIAFAIFKYRLYDIDILINKTLVYGALTGALALVYFSSVILLQQIFPAESPITIVLSTLAIAALFSPLRRRIQNGIDKRFYRRKYDAQQTLAAFGMMMRDEVELERISAALLAVAEETMQPATASLWLRDVKHSKRV